MSMRYKLKLPLGKARRSSTRQSTNRQTFSWLVLGALLGTPGIVGQLLISPAAAQRREPLAPPQSLEHLELEPGFTARVLAHEPQTIDPVEVAFDDRGRMWVVEMRDYPFRTAERPRGRIVVLTDTDVDGHYETAQTFADELEMPNGLAFWKDGLLVTVAGQLIYLPDADGDLRADQMQVWLEGFKEDNEQLRANHPRLGPDGWWYVACGLRGGQVKLGPALQSPSASPPLEIGSRDIRFNPRNSTIELVTGPAQFGLTFDALGHRLFCSNRNPATQVMMEQPDLQDNPMAGLAPSVQDVIASGDASRVFPLVEAWTTSHLHSGQFTAACGVFARPGSSLAGNELLTEVFACEPTGCLVRRQVSRLTGPALGPAENAEATHAEREWLASRDGWFRPVNVLQALDGEVIVVDMHRAVIEHPRWVPEELKNRPDERWGDQAGRIYWVGRDWSSWSRVLRDVQQRPLSSRSETELVALVGSSNPWLRNTATRLLLEREAVTAIESLLKGARDSHLTTEARIDSLRLAANLADLQAGTITIPLASFMPHELADAHHAALASVALQLGRAHPAWLAGLEDRIVELALSEASAGVQFEAWLTLGTLAAQGRWTAAEAVIDRAMATWTEQPDRYLLMAMGSALRNQPQRLLQSWLHAVDQTPSLTAAAQAQVPDIARSLIQAAMRQEGAAALDGLGRQVLQLIDAAHGTSSAAAEKSSAGSAAAQLAALVCAEQLWQHKGFRSELRDADWAHLAALCQAEPAAVDNRLAAVKLLAHSPRKVDAELLGQLARSPALPQLAGPLLNAWSAAAGAEADLYLLNSLPSASPQLQRVILPLIAAQPRRLQQLAERLEAGQVTPRHIGAAELTKLVSRAAEDLKPRLKAQLERISNSDRAAVLASYKDCLEMPSDAVRGQQLFAKHCASCHRIGELGVEVGPNISDSRTKQPLELLTAILDPNLAIDNNYFRFSVMTEDGRVVEGIVAEETADAIVIRGQDDRRERIRRDEIAEMQAAGVSLMPEGIEAQIDKQSMADLIAFVKGWRYLDGAIPGR